MRQRNKTPREQVAGYLPQMEHCTRCRADAVGLLGEPSSSQLVDFMRGLRKRIAG